MPEVITAKGHTGSISFDGTFVTITHRKSEKRIPVGAVTATQLKAAGGLINGFLSISLQGGAEQASSQWGSRTYNAVTDENSVVFTKKQGPAFAEIRQAIDAAIAARYA